MSAAIEEYESRIARKKNELSEMGVLFDRDGIAGEGFVGDCRVIVRIIWNEIGLGLRSKKTAVRASNDRYQIGEWYEADNYL